MNSLSARPNKMVRWPFRILASLIVMGCVLAAIATALAGWSHDTSLFKWQFFAALPGTAWLGRLAWYAAIDGKAPVSAHWPFASEAVLFWYGITLAVVWRA